MVDRWPHTQGNTTQAKKKLTHTPQIKQSDSCTPRTACPPTNEPVWERVRGCLSLQGPRWDSLYRGNTRPNLISSPLLHLYPILDSDKSPTNAWIRILSKGILICKTALFQEPVNTLSSALDDSRHIFTDCRLVLFIDISEFAISSFSVLYSQRYVCQVTTQIINKFIVCPLRSSPTDFNNTGIAIIY
jgi:hypothetical protein